MKRIVISTTTLILLSAGSALAATSGTPLDTVGAQVMTMVSGPIALLLIIAGFAGAGIIYFLSRNFAKWLSSRSRRWPSAACCARRFRPWRPICFRWRER